METQCARARRLTNISIFSAPSGNVSVPEANPIPVIELQGLSRTYRTGAGDVQALRPIDLRIHAGEFVAIMGPSGSGKTTFMNLIGCLDSPSGGSYRLSGQPVQQLSGNALAGLRNRRIGFVFQQFNLLGRASALDNVAMPLVYAGIGKRERLERARRALDDVGLSDRRHHTPAQLSGGQQQRVAIARALINDPQIVLADEPTGALDSRTSLEVMALLQRLNRRGQTVLFVTHEADVAAFANRVIMFRDGQLQDDRPGRGLDATTLLSKFV
jgi:putative ABC transport system ATP-binding protein